MLSLYSLCWIGLSLLTLWLLEHSSLLLLLCICGSVRSQWMRCTVERGRARVTWHTWIHMLKCKCHRRLCPTVRHSRESHSERKRERESEEGEEEGWRCRWGYFCICGYECATWEGRVDETLLKYTARDALTERKRKKWRANTTLHAQRWACLCVIWCKCVQLRGGHKVSAQRGRGEEIERTLWRWWRRGTRATVHSSSFLSGLTSTIEWSSSGV